MTCVAGVVERGRVYIGADSAGVAGVLTVPRRDEKVFINGPFLMGFTTSFRMGQLLRYALKPPEHHADEPMERFMAVAFVDAVRACLKAGGFATKKDEQETGGTALIGYRGRLFCMGSDYQIGEMIPDYAAIGCGEEIALGALYASSGAPDSQGRVLMALAAAAEFSVGVRAPFNVLHVGEGGSA